ncbi:hypothetical protein ACROYT_G024732 [Oculina patagonica]
MAACKLIFWFLFVVAVDETTAAVCTKINDCECKKSNGNVMSLKAVDSGTSKPGFTGIKGTKEGKLQTYTFSWNPCTKFTDDKCENVLLCQQDGGGKLTYPVAKTASSFAENNDGSITLTYEKVLYSGHTRIAKFNLVCDESQNPGKPATFKEEKGTGTDISQYITTFRSKCVCDGGCPDNPGGNAEQSKGLSTGSILLIVFFLLILFYIVAGLLFNKYNRGVESFPEMMPNHSFWADFSFLVKDGCVFTFQGVSACCRNSDCLKL